MSNQRSGTHDVESLAAPIEPPATVLLPARSLDPTAEQACTDLLAASAPSQREKVLLIALTGSPDDRIRTWEARTGAEFPSEAAVVTTSEPATPEPTDSEAEGSSTGASRPITVVPNPGDLTNLGIAVSERLSELSETDGRIVVCFHSLTVLLQYADLQRVFRFVHTLSGRMRACGALAHFHVDPAAHDERTITTLEPLFDVAVEFTDADGPTLTDLR